MRTGLLAISGWLVAALLTVGVSWSAISVVRDSVVQQTVVDTALPSPEETASATPTTAITTAGPAVAATRSLSGQGGSVTARCTNGRPTLVKVIPRQGFTAEPDDSGAEVQFRSSDHRTEITVRCTGNGPQLSKEEKASGGGGGGDDGGGGGDDSGGGRGGGGDN
jgi:uncharacterized membrane protein YgcG